MRDCTKRVYAWADGLNWTAGTKSLVKEDLLVLVIDGSLEYKCPPPRMRKRKRGSVSHYNPRKHMIYLVDFHQNPVIVLHEVAHAIARQTLKLGGHCKAWLGIFQWLMIRYQIMSKKFLKSSMAAYNLPWVPLSPKQIGIK